MGLVKFCYGTQLPATPSNDTLYFLSSGELYKGATLIADTTDTIAIQAMIDDAIGGIGKAVRFIGHSSTPLTDGGNETPTIDGEAFTELVAGDVVLYDNKEFILTASGKWELFGDEGSYATITALEELSDRVDKVVAGTEKVKNAEKADSATEANHALNADEATHALAADEATQAGFATTAGQASQALEAAEAHHALTADAAQTAVTAEKADTADSAQTAQTATYAEQSGLADNATNAENALNAENATKANSLNLGAVVGSTIKPVYFKADGLPEALTHTLEASVPSDAKFTDTIASMNAIAGAGNAVTDISVDATGKFTFTKGKTFALDSDLQTIISTLTWDIV